MSFSRRRLGKTGLEVGPIGIGGGGEVSSEDLLYAFDRGVNYFFFSSDLHHFAYSKMAGGLKQLCHSGSSVRDKVVLATVSYVNDPEKVLGVLYDQFQELGIDYIDVFHWGWVTDTSDCARLFETSRRVKEGGLLSKQLRYLLGVEERIGEVNEQVQRTGLVRHIGASFHSRQQAVRWRDDLDVLMLRYNISHRGVESEIFPLLSGDETRDPGIVAFNVGHEGTRYFNRPPIDYPSGYPVPTIPDCYRFALSHAAVDVVLTGPKDRKDIDAALAMLEKGQMSEGEIGFMHKYGAVHANRARIRVSPEKRDAASE